MAELRDQQFNIFGAVPEPIEVTGAELRTGDICAPGSFGIKSRKRILIVSGARPLDAVLGGRVEITIRVGGGPSVTGALCEDSVLTVVERPPGGAYADQPLPAFLPEFPGGGE